MHDIILLISHLQYVYFISWNIFSLVKSLFEEYPSNEEIYFPLEYDFREMLNLGINDLPIVTHCMSFIL
jgi:hypothetical protein